MENIKTVAVIGLGYIGLPTAAILASKGIEVVGVDVKQSTVDAVNRGEVPFVEPDLGTYLAGAVSQGNLTASTKTPNADAYIIAVPTPFKGDHAPDLSYIDAAADAIAPQLFGGELIILESTCPPGATEHLADRILGLRPDLHHDGEVGLYFAHCPERVLPGQVMIELVTNDRIVGGITPKAARRAKALYEVFCQGDIHLTDAKTAEMAKLVENAFRDVNIAFANEVAKICEKLHVDSRDLIALANRHPRVNVLDPGIGVGGHCIAVDPWFLVNAAPEQAQLIFQARLINDARPLEIAQTVAAKVLEIGAQSIALLGLSYKPNVGDVRESPALHFLKRLDGLLTGVKFELVDPHLTESLDLTLNNPFRLSTLQDMDATGVVIIATGHSEFYGVDALMQNDKAVFDIAGALRRRSIDRSKQTSEGE